MYRRSSFLVLSCLCVELLHTLAIQKFVKNIQHKDTKAPRHKERRPYESIDTKRSIFFFFSEGSRLTGRYIQLDLYPYSFAEKLECEYPNSALGNFITTEQRGLAAKVFAAYQLTGGIPSYVQTGKLKYSNFFMRAYFIDHAMARLLGFRSTEDKGRLLENLIYRGSCKTPIGRFLALLPIFTIRRKSPTLKSMWICVES